MRFSLRHAMGWVGILLLAASGCSNPSSQQAPSETPSPIPTATLTPSPVASPTPEFAMTADARLAEIRMIDARSGWAWAADGAGQTWLLHTDDGGDSWAIVTPQIPASYDLGDDLSFFLDSRSAWLLIHDPSGGARFFVRTLDGGSTWTSMPLEVVLDQFGFQDEDNGWGQSSETRGGSWTTHLYRTTDGGLTWTPVSLPPPPSYGDSGADPQIFVGCNTCGDRLYYDLSRAMLFYSDQYSDPANAVRFSISLDQGSRWYDLALPLPEPEPPGGQVYSFSPAFVDDKNGFLSVRITNQAYPNEDAFDVFAVYATQDGGLTWTLASVIDNPTHQAVPEIQFSSRVDGFANAAGFLYTTHDGAQTWLPVATMAQFAGTGAGRPIFQFDFVDARSGWIVSGSTGDTKLETTLWTTGDGGLTWAQTAFSLDALRLSGISLHQLDMLDPLNGWAWAFDSASPVLHRTSDSGQTWTDVSPANIDFSLNASFFLDAEHAWIEVLYTGGDESGFLYTADGGKTWIAYDPVNLVSRGFRFLNAADGWLEVSEAGAGELTFSIYETHDSGASWTQAMIAAPLNLTLPVTQPGTLPLCDLCGDRASFDSPHLTLIFGNLQAEAGQALSLLFSTDLGGSWQSAILDLPPVQAADGYATGSPPVFFDELNGLLPVNITNRNSPNPYSVLTLYATNDGGETWTRRPAVLNEVETSDRVQFVSPTDAFVRCGDELCVTHDAAESWQNFTADWSFSAAGPGERALQWDFTDATTGWVISGTDPDGKTTLWRTDDSGLSWVVLTPRLAP